MEIKGKIKQLLPIESGVGKESGKEWKKSGVVITFKDGNYEKDLALTVMGSKVDELSNLRVGIEITASITPSSREYNGKWYTDCAAWKIVADTTAPNEPVSDMPF